MPATPRLSPPRQPLRVPRGTFHAWKIKRSKGLGLCRAGMLVLAAPGRYLGCLLGMKAARTDPRLQWPEESSRWRPAALIFPISIWLVGNAAEMALFPSSGSAVRQWGAGVPQGLRGDPSQLGGGRTHSPCSHLLSLLCLPSGSQSTGRPRRAGGRGGGLCARPGATRVIPSVPRRSPIAETPVHQTAGAPGAPHQAQPAPQHPPATGQTLPLYPPLLYW